MAGQGFIFGLLSFQVLFIILQWYFYRRTEFIYYGLYLVLFIAYLYAYYEPQFGFTNIFGNNVVHIQLFTRTSGLLIYYCYLHFARQFTESKNLFPDVDKHMQWLGRFLMSGIFLQLIFAGFVKDNTWREWFSWIFFVPGFIWGFVIGFKLILNRNKLISIIIIGSLFAIAGAFIQAVFDGVEYFYGSNYHTSSIIMEVGFLIEIFFLNIGFLYKNRLLQQQEQAVQGQLLLATQDKNTATEQLNEVRLKLAMDLHDDVSSSIGNIRILSSIVNMQAKDNVPLAKLNTAINELASTINILVWSFNNNNDSLIRFVDYIKNYAETTLSDSDVNFLVQSPAIKDATLNGNVRKNVFLVIKEAIHNTLKYAQASLITITIEQVKANTLRIHISDNGQGFNEDAAGKGNGLSNMQKRMQSIGGTCLITEHQGVTISLTFPY
jgi:signal transduction histidine kinase